MNVYEAILKRRSIRKFKQEEISIQILNKLVNAARLAPQGANLQPMKYIIVNDTTLLPSVFATTKWAAYLKGEGTPKEGERPTAYIVALCDIEIKKSGWDVDAGAAIENLILTATEEGIGSCWIGSVDREELRKVLNIPDQYYLHSVIALGYPAERSVAEDENGSIKYYKDENGVIHVPKRKFEDIVFYNRMDLKKGDSFNA